MATSPATSPKPSPRPRPKPKGILKKSSSSTTASPIAAPIDFPSSFSLTAPTPPAPPQPEPSRLELLAQQEQAARIRLLEKLKATEIRPAVPLATFEILSQFPRSHPPTTTPPPSSTSTSNPATSTPAATTPTKAPPPIKYTAANPHPTDVSDLLTHLSTFQPSEYLDLIEERNCLDKCGYALCARPRRTHDAPFKITAAGGIARAEDLNKWCSDACAKRGLYLKVQLDNPSYVRGPDGGMVVKLELRKEGGSGAGAGSTGGEKKVGSGAAAATAVSPRGTETDRNQLAQAMAQLEIDRHKRPPNKKTQQDRKDASALAGERGDSAGGRLTDFSRVEVTIKESDVDAPAEAPSAPSEDAQGLIEGYKPKFGTVGDGKNAEEGAESDDDDEFFSVRF